MISGLLLTIAEAQSHNAKNHSQAAEASHYINTT